MARTYKHYPVHSCFRTPRGHRQARRAGLRKRKTPPDAWDDAPFDVQCWLPHRVASGLAKKGLSHWEIVHHVQRKFKMLLDDAIWAAECGECSRPKTPDGCLRVYDERNEMALHRARKIAIGESVYRWKVSGRGGLHLAVEKEGEKGRNVFWLEEGTVVTPGFVKGKIREKRDDRIAAGLPQG